MPKLIEHIDAIARSKWRDVLSIRFYTRGTVREYDYRKDSERRRVIDWLDEKGISWQPCGEVANENALHAYRGDLYVDVPFDPSDLRFQELQAYLENPDGTMRHPSVTFEYYPLAMAMRNAHQDEPGFLGSVGGRHVVDLCKARCDTSASLKAACLVVFSNIMKEGIK